MNNKKEILWESKSKNVIECILKLKEKHNIEKFQAIELFCGDGHSLSGQMAELSEFLIGYEINSEKEKEFKKNIINGEFRLQDSVKMMKEIEEGDIGTYNLIGVDAPCCIFGDNYCEHFEILGYVYKLMENGEKIVCVFPIVHKPYDVDKQENQSWMKRREIFYKTGEIILDLDKILNVYDDFFEKQNLIVHERSYVCREHRNRIDWLYEFVYVLEKQI